MLNISPEIPKIFPCDRRVRVAAGIYITTYIAKPYVVPRVRQNES